MKIIFNIILFCIACEFSAQAQDLIITSKGDSLNCKITKIKNGYIHFTFKYENDIRNTLISTKELPYYQKNFYANPEVPADKIKSHQVAYKKLRVGLFGGLSSLTGKVIDVVDPDLRKYYKSLKSGYHVGGDATFFVSENIGFGAKYSVFRTSNEIKMYGIDTLTNQLVNGKQRDDITIQYFGPSICTRINSANKKASFLSEFSVWYLRYKNNAVFFDYYSLSGRALGVLFNTGFDYSIHENVALGLFLSYTYGKLNEVTFSDNQQTQLIKFNKNQTENISRIDISIGLHWNW